MSLKSATSGSETPELEQQLLEMGFTEGARVEILHEGALSRDPIAVRVNHITIALRRREALAVVVQILVPA
jgi:ferrous iron transport protein A